jgi:hypothetical protein
MTRHRALKTIIRARAAKTGERYTTARRHVLDALRSRTGRPAPGVEAPANPIARGTRSAAATSAKGAVSEPRVRERTGHDLAHWFAVLDGFGAATKGHTAAARHLRQSHGIDSWYSQGITVAYERARGLRSVNQRRAGHFEFSASKVVRADSRTVIAAFTGKRRRARWLADADPDLARTLSAALDGAGGFTFRTNGEARCRYKWNDAAVELHVAPKAADASSVVVQNVGLPSAAAVEERRAKWRAALAALAAYLAA